MSNLENREALGYDLVPPVILGGAGDIGRTALQQIVAEGVVPAGVVLTPHRLEFVESRRATALEIATNYSPCNGGDERVIEDVKLLKTRGNPILRVGGMEIPVFTPETQHEIFAEGHPVIDATGQHKKREKLDPFLEAGAEFVVVTSPIHEREGIRGVVYGVNSTQGAFDQAVDDRLLSTSSCTTTAVTSFIGPLIEAGIVPSQISVNVAHARTKSNDREKIKNNIVISSSGAKAEVPKILRELSEDFKFGLECTRTDVNCGSLASIKMIFDRQSPGRSLNIMNMKRYIDNAIRGASAVTLVDAEIEGTKGVISRKESALVNTNHLDIEKAGDVAVVSGVCVYYDNVHGYTRSALDSLRRLAHEIKNK